MAIGRLASNRWGASLSGASVTARISSEPMPLKRAARAAPLPSHATHAAPVWSPISWARFDVTTSSSPLAITSNATRNSLMPCAKPRKASIDGPWPGKRGSGRVANVGGNHAPLSPSRPRHRQRIDPARGSRLHPHRSRVRSPETGRLGIGPEQRIGSFRDHPVPPRRASWGCARRQP